MKYEKATTVRLSPPDADARMRHDYPILQQFHAKHALGALAAPSCLCCGQQTHPITRPIAVQHMELPAIVVCKQCKDATAGVTPSQPRRRYRHIGYAKYVPHSVGGGSSLVCCGPDEPGAFRMFREPPTHGVPGTLKENGNG